MEGTCVCFKLSNLLSAGRRGFWPWVAQDTVPLDKPKGQWSSCFPCPSHEPPAWRPAMVCASFTSFCSEPWEEQTGFCLRDKANLSHTSGLPPGRRLGALPDTYRAARLPVCLHFSFASQGHRSPSGPRPQPRSTHTTWEPPTKQQSRDLRAAFLGDCGDRAGGGTVGHMESRDLGPSAGSADSEQED